MSFYLKLCELALRVRCGSMGHLPYIAFRDGRMFTRCWRCQYETCGISQKVTP